jgi:YYY domain-containing protein
MSETPFGSRWLVWTALAILVLAGLTLRVWNLNFDRGMGSHPDERSTACFYAPTIDLPTSWDEFWDPTSSPLNPLWDRGLQQPRKFTYGHFPLYLGVAMGRLWAAAAPVAQGLGAPAGVVDLMDRAKVACDALAVAGRAMIALLDTLTIVLVYHLGRRLFGRGAGLLAAAFYTFTAQAIQLSHFFAMDPASTTFTVMAVLGSVQMGQSRRWSGVWLAGVGAGLAIASKFSALPILVAPVTAGVLAAWELGHNQEGSGSRQLAALLQVAVTLALAGIVFFLASPYAVLDWTTFVQATLVEQGQMVRGIADMPFTRQYRNTLPYLYFIRQQVQWGMGWPLGLLALAGTLVMAARLMATGIRQVWGQIGRKTFSGLSAFEIGNVVVWSWIIPYFGLTGAFLAKFNRYMSPLLPFFVVFGAGLVWTVWRARRVDEAGEEAPRRWAASWLAAGVAAVALIGAAGWSVAYVNGVYGREHTWITASRWVYEHAAAGSALLWEQWDDPLPKAIPSETGMDMAVHGLRNIDWGPYEEESAEKYAILKQRLREADYVVYSSKRIYDSVDELPERYPMTTLYYDAMWDGRLGFELVAEFTSPPRLLGIPFDDRHADESWSLYDHPQVTVFRKVRDLSDAEFDALFDRAWTRAIPHYRGKDSPLSPLLEVLGMGSGVASGERGLVSMLLGWLSGPADERQPVEATAKSLLLDRPLDELPLVDNYRWNAWGSQNSWRAAITWWVAAALLGWLAWPIAWRVFRPLRDRGYLLSKCLGWLLPAWPVWLVASSGVAANTVLGAWLAVGGLGVAGAVVAWRERADFGQFIRRNWGLLVAEEALFTLAYGVFLLLRIANPDLWQPWHGGEKFMEFAFLNGILRSPTFPPVDPHFAGGFINYYYYGIYLVAFLVKLTGIYAEVAFNLTIALLFALTVGNAFSIAHTMAVDDDGRGWRAGFGAALVAPVCVAVLGNLDGFGQVVRNLSGLAGSSFESALPGAGTAVAAVRGAAAVAQGSAALPGYDFWGPSRVIPNTINEFPYWSFLFADLHPHLIAMPLAVLFVGCVAAILAGYGDLWSARRADGVFTLAILTFLLGTLASVNLWEVPTYAGLGVLAIAAGEYREVGRLRFGRLAILTVVYMVGAYLLYQPFFAAYANVGASGVGWVREGDDLGRWLLVWGLLGFVVVSWLAYKVRGQPCAPRSAVRPEPIPLTEEAAETVSADMAEDGTPDRVDWHPEAVFPRRPAGQAGTAAVWSLIARRYDRLPRILRLHALVVRRASLGYLLWTLAPVALALAGVAAWVLGRAVLGLCLVALAPAAALIWRRREQATSGDHLIVLLSATGLVILAGTQVVYLKDFLQGGDWYRMNTLFKFFVQVWVLWGMAAGLALPRLWRASRVRSAADAPRKVGGSGLRLAWRAVAVMLLTASSAYLLLGTPARLEQRMVGWRPPFGTLNALDFMKQGSFSWPDENHRIELGYDRDAIDWLLAHVRGNVVIVESAQVDYYRAGGTRIASLTGLSGLRGMHESEQRYGEQVAARERLHREFWEIPSVERTQAIIDELGIGLVYVGQLERQQHPEGVAKLERMADAGQLTPIYANEKVVVYAVAGRLAMLDGDTYVPNASDSGG